MTIPQPKPYHHGNLHESLVSAGEAALAELPLEDVSLREIARRAGVSHAAPKHHFGTLGALLGEIAARGAERFVNTLADAASRGADQSAAARLQAMARAYVRFALENPAVYGLMFGRRAAVEYTPHLAQAMFAAWDQLQNQVGAIVGAQRAPLAAVTVWSTVHGLAMLRLDSKIPPHLDTDEAVNLTTRTMVAGLVAEG